MAATSARMASSRMSTSASDPKAASTGGALLSYTPPADASSSAPPLTPPPPPLPPSSAAPPAPPATAFSATAFSTPGPPPRAPGIQSAPLGVRTGVVKALDPEAWILDPGAGPNGVGTGPLPVGAALSRGVDPGSGAQSTSTHMSMSAAKDRGPPPLSPDRSSAAAAAAPRDSSGHHSILPAFFSRGGPAPDPGSRPGSRQVLVGSSGRQDPAKSGQHTLPSSPSPYPGSITSVSAAGVHGTTVPRIRATGSSGRAHDPGSAGGGGHGEGGGEFITWGGSSDLGSGNVWSEGTDAGSCSSGVPGRGGRLWSVVGRSIGCFGSTREEEEEGSPGHSAESNVTKKSKKSRAAAAAAGHGGRGQRRVGPVSPPVGPVSVSPPVDCSAGL